MKREEGQNGSIWGNATGNRRRELPVRVIGVGVKMRADFLALLPAAVCPFSRYRFLLFFLFVALRCLEGQIMPPWNRSHFQAITSNKSTATFPC